MAPESAAPEDTQWDERPRGALSRALSSLGWLIAIVWILGMAVYIVWQITSNDESIQIESMIGFALLSALALIVLSALVDRLKTRKNDPYRKVQK